MPFVAPLAVLLLLAAPASIGPAETAPAAPAGGDQATLQAMHQAYLGLTAARGRAHLLLGELNAVRYDEKLAALARARPEEAARTEATRHRLTEAWTALYAAVGGQQPIDPRGACRLEERTLREALAGAAGSAAGARLPAARDEAARCLGRLSASHELARSRVAALEAGLAEARQALGLPAGERR